MRIVLFYFANIYGVLSLRLQTIKKGSTRKKILSAVER